ncbi:nitric oxide reductase activation protein NorD [Marinobacter subterrani]|uniref:nitric oxide reductase activation protein NorD n=1 Tax=Marinobacter subterrani TaxID=1658765 RepID=UPI0023537010|nr:nitric oxide reductase activation protein NorD [Marinobacter subterrani]
MEEFIGKIWDRWVTRQVTSDFTGAAVHLTDLQAELTLYYRALGGAAGKTLEPADTRKVRLRRTGMQRVAGSHQRIALPWQDDRSVRLPASLAVFPSPRLNTSLYYWLVAMAARLPPIRHWFRDNQQAVLVLTSSYPGLNRQYKELVAELMALRPPVDDIPEDLRRRELAVAQALREPGLLADLPSSAFDCFPVWLWLYPQPPTLFSVPVATTGSGPELEAGERSSEQQTLQQRKQAQRIDDEHETDGLLVFLPDSLMSWTEQINLDRCQDDDSDDDFEQIANDIDLITVSRQRKATAAKVKFDLDLPAAENDELCLGPGIRLPEWHYRKGRLRPDVCLLQPLLADEAEPVSLPAHLRQTSEEVRRKFALVGLGNTRLRGQPDGQDLDLDAWIDEYSKPLRDTARQNFFLDQRKTHRDFCCLILADLSLSTEGYVSDDCQVIDVIRDSLMVLAEGLDQTRDDFAIYGFSSVRNSHVRYQLMKNFGEPYSDRVRGRIARIKPGFYTRMGAAIRQSSRILERQPQAHRVLLLVSDGKPNDLDQYEGRYGIEDTRQAIIEARQLGITPYCVTVDECGHDYLPYLFGRDGFAVVSDPTQLPRVLPRIYLNVSTH